MSPFGRKPAPLPAMGNPKPLGAPELPPKPPAEGEPDGDEGGGGDLTPEMLDYSGPDEQCGKCKHFTAPSTCDRWTTPVEETGHCEGFQSGGGENPDEGAAEDIGSAENEEYR